MELSADVPARLLKIAVPHTVTLFVQSFRDLEWTWLTLEVGDTERHVTVSISERMEDGGSRRDVSFVEDGLAVRELTDFIAGLSPSPRAPFVEALSFLQQRGVPIPVAVLESHQDSSRRRPRPTSSRR